MFVVKNGKFLEKVFLAKGEWEDSTNSTRLENLCYHIRSSIESCSEVGAPEVVPGFAMVIDV